MRHNILPAAARQQAAALGLIALGAWLRLRQLASMEFKADEQLALQLASDLIANPPWVDGGAWPAHGMLSSHNIGNAPLFTWLVAGAWQVVSDPVWVAAAIALVNVACLYPLWRWALRHVSDSAAITMLAVLAVNPLAVMYSRKIWTQSLLCIGVVLTLWAIERWRSGRTWTALTFGLLALLFLGQLHQSGPIALAVLPLALATQWFVDRRANRPPRKWHAPSPGEAAAVASALAVTLFFWVPYINYLLQLPFDVVSQRPTLPAVSPDFLWRIVAQVRPTDVIDLFPRDLDDFVAGPVRRAALTASIWLGTPLAFYGIWRWFRAPHRLPVVGLWWVAITVVFVAARIPAHAFYVLVLMPLPALLASGGLDGALPEPVVRGLTAWRVSYIVALLALTVSMQNWLFERGGATFGSTGGYGVAYEERMAQARAIVVHTREDRLPEKPESYVSDDLECRQLPRELLWLAGWLDPAVPSSLDSTPLQICDGFRGAEGAVRYRWRLASVPAQ